MLTGSWLHCCFYLEFHCFLRALQLESCINLSGLLLTLPLYSPINLAILVCNLSKDEIIQEYICSVTAKVFVHDS